MNEGLTSKEIKAFHDLVLKANDDQVKALEEHLYDERFKRITNRAWKDLETGD